MPESNTFHIMNKKLHSFWKRNYTLLGENFELNLENVTNFDLTKKITSNEEDDDKS